MSAFSFSFFILIIWLVSSVAETIVKATNFPWTYANTSIWLSSATYCPTDSYLSREYIGASNDFNPVYTLSDIATDSHGFVGLMHAQERIYVVFRGSTSAINWMNDFEAMLTEYYQEGCRNCSVHSGFLKCYSSLRDQTLDAVADLKRKYPSYEVIVTGHSLGGALATLASIDLLTTSVTRDLVRDRVDLITFGSPRVGNAGFSSFASGILPDTVRVTHYKDPAPHVPPIAYYQHIAGEWYEDQSHVITACEAYEDPTCADQWRVTYPADHMLYLDLHLGCKSVSGAKDLEILRLSGHVDPVNVLV